MCVLLLINFEVKNLLFPTTSILECLITLSDGISSKSIAIAKCLNMVVDTLVPCITIYIANSLHSYIHVGQSSEDHDHFLTNARRSPYLYKQI